MFDELVAAVLHVTRVGQINGCASEAYGLLALLTPRGGLFARRDAASALALKGQSLAEHLSTRRHYVDHDCNSSRATGTSELGVGFHSVRTGAPLVKQMRMGGSKRLQSSDHCSRSC